MVSFSLLRVYACVFSAFVTLHMYVRTGSLKLCYCFSFSGAAVLVAAGNIFGRFVLVFFFVFSVCRQLLARLVGGGVELAFPVANRLCAVWPPDQWPLAHCVVGRVAVVMERFAGCKEAVKAGARKGVSY